jgi:hypothetical protein
MAAKDHFRPRTSEPRGSVRASCRSSRASCRLACRQCAEAVDAGARQADRSQVRNKLPQRSCGCASRNRVPLRRSHDLDQGGRGASIDTIARPFSSWPVTTRRTVRVMLSLGEVWARIIRWTTARLQLASGRRCAVFCLAARRPRRRYATQNTEKSSSPHVHPAWYQLNECFDRGRLRYCSMQCGPMSVVGRLGHGRLSGTTRTRSTSVS